MRGGARSGPDLADSRRSLSWQVSFGRIGAAGRPDRVRYDPARSEPADPPGQRHLAGTEGGPRGGRASPHAPKKVPDPRPAAVRGTLRVMTDRARRREMSVAYAETPRRAGVFLIRNTESGRTWVAPSLDLDSELHKFDFAKSTGSTGVFHRSLVPDLERLGWGAFQLEIVEELPPAANGRRRRRATTSPRSWRCGARRSGPTSSTEPMAWCGTAGGGPRWWRRSCRGPWSCRRR